MKKGKAKRLVINEDFVIDDESTNERKSYVLIQRVDVKDNITCIIKNKYIKFYYGDIEQALRGYLTHSIELPETLMELRTQVWTLAEEIELIKRTIERPKLRKARP